jgi:hypothetical protein
MLNFRKLAGLAAAALVASVMAASAAPVIAVSNTLPVPVANPLATSKTAVGTGVLENVIGNKCTSSAAFDCQSGIYARSPWEGTAYHATGQYTSISGGNQATYTPGGLFNQVSFVWGSPDTYNTLQIILSGPGGSTESIIPSTTNGLLPPAGSLAKFVIISAITFDTITFKSGTNAFEFANLTLTPVPLPAAGLLLLAGLGGVGLLSRRRAA